MKNIYIARMMTEGLEWIATGESEEQAKAAILKKWNQWIMSDSDDENDRWSLQELESTYEIETEQTELGQCVTM